MKSLLQLHEFVVAVHSPFSEAGHIAPDVVDIQAKFLAFNKVRTVFITGTTGECHSLTYKEKALLHEAWAVASKAHGLQVIAHVGSNCLEEARSLARESQAHGFAAVSALAPSYFKPATLSLMIQCAAYVAEAAPSLPFYYYDIPSLTGVHFPMDTFLRMAVEKIPTFAGIKFTNPDLIAYRRALQVAGERLELPWGMDEMWLSAWAAGARGGVGSTYNWAPELYRKITQAAGQGDFKTAQRLQSVSIDMVDAMNVTGFLGTAKALMTRLGVPVGPARLPLPNPVPNDVDAMFARLKELGFDQWGAKQPGT